MAATRIVAIVIGILVVTLLIWAVVVSVLLGRELQKDGPKDEPVALHFVDREITWSHKPGQCGNILDSASGSEDLTILPNGLMFVSSGIYPPAKGIIQLVDLRNPGQTLRAVTLPVDGDTFVSSTFQPHGITTWQDPTTGEITLLVISHPPDEDKIEVFTFNQTSRRLKHIRSITDPEFAFMNDLVAVDKDKFYITYYYKGRGGNADQEIAEKQKNGKILYYDGRRAEVMKTGFFLSNGINMSPDKRYIYMAEIGTGVIWVFSRDMDNNALTTFQTKYVGTGIDNIEVNPTTGDMWIGCHPLFNQVMHHVNNIHDVSIISPSQVLRVKVNDGNITDVIEVFLDDGQLITASTTASYYSGRIFIGSLHREFVWCEATCID